MAPHSGSNNGKGIQPSGPVEIRMYNVGFGDCFLLTFPYTKEDGGDRHVLIDFGSSENPKNAVKNHMLEVAKDIAKQCNGARLTAVVVTHRHKDHLSGFAPKEGGGGTGDIIAELEPELVIQPWTEDPDVAKDAIGPGVAPARGTRAMHVRGLEALHGCAEHALKYAMGNRSLPRAVVREMAFIGETNLKNLDAIENLMAMGEDGKSEYLSHGDQTALAGLLPGVKIHVLGPPTPEQWEQVATQTDSDPEFWMLYSRLWRALAKESASASGGPLFPDTLEVPVRRAKFDQRWFISQVDRLQREMALSLVRALDDALNNTSLILLFEVGDQRLLFPGDAQIENWRYALTQVQGTRELLEGVTVYKVGHHGSRNATPRTLWKWFENKGKKQKPGRLKTLMSTKPGKHGSAQKRTEVPRKTLVDELKAESDYTTTQTFKKGVLSDTV